MKEKSAVEKFIARHQQWVIALIVLPISFLLYLKETFVHFLFHSGPENVVKNVIAHEVKVKRVIKDVKEWNALPKKVPIRTNRSGKASHSVRDVDKSKAFLLDMGDFNSILELDEKEGYVRVEPFVQVGQLTTHLLKFGLMLEATLEMEEATIGGLALTQGMTTHSNACGLVHETVRSYEYVTGAGEYLKASAGENVDVFRCSGFSAGTLGFLVALEIKVVPVSKFVLVKYHTFHSVDELYAAYMKQFEDSFFVEAIVYSKTHSVLISGSIITKKDEEKLARVPVNHLSRWYKEWFFEHARKSTNNQQERMPIRDYLMRHDRSMCMTLLYVFPVGNSAWFRYLFGWLLPPKVTFLKGLRNKEAREDSCRSQIYQDLGFPHHHLKEMIDLLDRTVEIYPLLLYPCTMNKEKNAFLRGNETKVKYLNLGVYGVPKKFSPKFKTITLVREILSFVRKVNGFEHSYCDVFQTKEEFYEMFDYSQALACRKRIASDNLPELYDKIKVDVPWEEWVKEEAMY